MNRKQCKCTDILLIDLSAGPKSRKDHFVKFLPGQVADGIIIQLHCAGPFGTAGYPMDSSVLIIRYTVATPIFGSSAEAL